MSGRQMRRPASMGVLVMVALALLALPGLPAAADHTAPPGEVAGSGSLEGTETLQDEQFTGSLCFEVTRSVFGLRGAGTYVGRTSSGQEAVYKAEIGQGETLYGNGPLLVEVENTQTYYHGPSGTHGTSDATCGPGTAEMPAPAEFRLFAADHVYRLDGSGTQVPCSGTGTFSRGHSANNPNWHAEWTLAQDCTVVGNAAGTPGTGISKAGTTITHAGTHAACFTPPCVDNFHVSYKQYPPAVGLHLALSGPSTAQVGNPVTVVARLTQDGVPVPNEPVHANITGPGPGGTGATPSQAAGATGADGRVSFTFTGAVAGTYNVVAIKTASLGAVNAQLSVRFQDPPPTAIALDGPARAQTEEGVTVAATVTSAGTPAPGAVVSFAVSGAGQATPAAGSAVTDASGKATFTFTGDRAGEYTATASTTAFGQAASATHTVRLDIKSFHRVGSLTFQAAGDGQANEPQPSSAVIDPAGRYAYLASGPRIIKLDLATFERVGVLELAADYFSINSSAVVDPAGSYAYFTTANKIVKIDLNAFQRVGALLLEPGETNLASGVIDPAGNFAYFGIYTSNQPASVVKVDLTTFQRVGSLTFGGGAESVQSAVMDPAGRYAYFGADGEGQTPGRVLRVDLATFQNDRSLTLSGTAEQFPESAVMDPAGRYGYFATQGGRNSVQLVKVDLLTMQRVGAAAMTTEVDGRPTVALMDPAGRFAYVGVIYGGESSPAFPPRIDRVVKFDLATLEQVGEIVMAPEEKDMGTALMDPAGQFAYFGMHFDATPFVTDVGPGRVVKLAVSRAPKAALVAGNDAFATPYETPLAVPAPGVLGNDSDTEDGDPLTAQEASDPAHGTVALQPDGSFAYTPDAGFFGSDSFTYRASDAMDLSSPATVSVAVAAPPPGARGSAYGFFSRVSLFGGPAEPRGPAPTVALPLEGSASPVTATAPSGDAVYGPAFIFTSDQIDVSTQGMPGGTVSSSTAITNVNRSEQEVLTAASMASSCTASSSGRSGSTTITGGTLRVSEGEPDVEGDDTYVTLPVDPDPNTVYNGQLESVGDYFQYIFNEQVLNPDGSITVYAAHQKLLGPTAIGDLYIGKSECGVTGNGPPPVEAGAVADFDGDGATDVSVFRPSTGVWYLRQSTGGDRAVAFGAEGDVPVPGDYDGDGTTDLGIYRPSNGVWYLRQSTAGDSASQFGADGDVPVPGDYDGDGTTDLGVYRPSTGVWYLRQSNDGDRATQFGAEGDVATPGDYDGDGTTDLGVFRPATGVWYIRQSTAGDRASEFGAAGDVPVPGDYDADGTTDLGVYRPTTGTWYLRQSTDGDRASEFGVTGDVPVPGDYDADGTTDLGVHRPETNVWYLRRSTTGDTATQFGAPGDIPLPVPAAIRQSAFP